jgi:hypothetical protein
MVAGLRPFVTVGEGPITSLQPRDDGTLFVVSGGEFFVVAEDLTVTPAGDGK